MLGAMSGKYVHTCVRVQDIDKSVAFYGLLGFERRGQLNFDSAYNVYLGLPDDGDVLELTVNVGREAPYDLGEGYNHMALVADDLDGLLERLAAEGVTPDRPPYAPGRTGGVPDLLRHRPGRLPDRADRQCVPHAAGPAAPVAGSLVGRA